MVSVGEQFNLTFKKLHIVNIQRFRLFLWCGLLTLPAVFVHKADAATLTKRVTVQPIQVCDNWGLSCAITKFFEPETDKIWSQAGIDINFLPLRKLDKTNFLTIDNKVELTSLFTGAGNQQNSDHQVLNMWFLDKLNLSSGELFGITEDIGERNIAISNDVFTYDKGQGRRDTIAHEIGHSLGLEHTTLGAGGKFNLMTDGNDRRPPTAIKNIFPDGNKTDQLTPEQIKLAKSSKYASSLYESSSTGFSVNGQPAASVPEPSAILSLIGFGLFGLYTQLKSKKNCFRNL